MKKTTKIILILIVLLVVIGISLAIGHVPIPLLRPSAWDATQQTAFFQVRLPRVLLAIVVGAALSGAGAAYQGVFQNPLASPDVLGATAGAGFGAALAISLELRQILITGMAFGMSLLTVGLVFVIGRRVSGERTVALLLAGLMISSLFQAGISYLKLVADPNNKLPSITYWLMGSLADADVSCLLFVLIPSGIGLILLLLGRWCLNVLSMGDDAARSMGVHPERLRGYMLLGATLLTAAAVSAAGMIGWVGLVVPHMTRRIIGSDYRTLLPASLLGGSLFLLVVDDLCRTVASSEIPIGILTAVIGVPLFLALILRKKGGS